MRVKSKENSFSYSKLSCFHQCSRQFKFKYVQRIESDLQGIESFVGNVVHDTMEYLYNLVMIDMTPTLGKLREVYDFFWTRGFSHNIRVSKQPPPPVIDYYFGGVSCIERWYEGNYPFNNDTTLKTEIHVGYHLTEDIYIHGYIDRLLLDKDGTLVIQDYKTASKIPSSDELDQTYQLSIYENAVRDMVINEELELPGVEIKEDTQINLSWPFMRHDKVLNTCRTVHQLDDANNWIIDTVHQIRESEELDHFPSRLTFLCEWCEYNTLCEAYQAKEMGTDLDMVSDSKPHKFIRSLVEA